jgi:hypothetical protein
VKRRQNDANPGIARASPNRALALHKSLKPGQRYRHFRALQHLAITGGESGIRQPSGALQQRPQAAYKGPSRTATQGRCALAGTRPAFAYEISSKEA